MNSEKGMYTFNRLEKKYESWISWMIVKQNKVKIILHKKPVMRSIEILLWFPCHITSQFSQNKLLYSVN